MTIARTWTLIPFFTYCLLTTASVIYGPQPAVAQEMEASGQQTQGMLPVSDLDSASKSLDDPQESPAQPTICGPAHLGRCLKDVVKDQAGIWTSPLRIRSNDILWILPFAGATGAAIHYDVRAQQELGIDQSRIDASNNISLFGSTYATVAEGGALYLIGRLKKDDHLAETGRLE